MLFLHGFPEVSVHMCVCVCNKCSPTSLRWHVLKAPSGSMYVAGFDCQCSGLQSKHGQGGLYGVLNVVGGNVLPYYAVLVLMALPAEGDAKGVPCSCCGHEVSVS